ECLEQYHGYGCDSQCYQEHRLCWHAPDTGELLIEGAGLYLGVVAPGQEYDDDVEGGEHHQVDGRHKEDVAKQVAHRVCVARRLGYEEDTYTHAYGPDSVDYGVLPLFCAQRYIAYDGS